MENGCVIMKVENGWIVEPSYTPALAGPLKRYVFSNWDAVLEFLKTQDIKN